jgi:UvrB/uvrC motif.
MQREMETAIAKELYERAAELRDAIKLLASEEALGHRNCPDHGPVALPVSIDDQIVKSLAGLGEQREVFAPMATHPTQYAHPEALVETDWLEKHLNDEGIRIIESNEDVLPLRYRTHSWRSTY